MRILVAPDKFKGTLTAGEAAEAIAAGLRDAWPGTEIDQQPIADGGEGTAEIVCRALNGIWVETSAHDALARRVETRFAWVAAQKLALMDMSETAGLFRLTPEELNPEIANTFGVGEMMLAAAAHGAESIMIGLGGSATNDGGWGMAQALGYEFLAENGSKIGKVGGFELLERIVNPHGAEGAPPSARRATRPLPGIVAAADVRNPLLGPNGATRVFGLQKGVKQQGVEAFETALTRFADVADRHFGTDHREAPGAGAAGGLAFGLMTFCGATMKPGFDYVADLLGLRERVLAADIVITGEGQLDAQTLEGKAPAGMARLARACGKNVYAIVGRVKGELPGPGLFNAVYPVASVADGKPEKNAAIELLRRAARLFALDLKA